MKAARYNAHDDNESGDDSMPPECEFVSIDVDGGTLNVALAGEGPPLIMLHGWTLDHRAWTPQIAEIGARYRLIMPDRRGFGRSSAPPDLARECDDIDRMADALSLDKFSIAGMSQAGVIALNYCITRPERVHAAITLGSPLAGTVPGGDQFDRERWAAMACAGQITALREEWLKHPLMQSASPQGRELLEQIVGNYEARDLQSPSMLPTMAAEQLRELEVPLLALVGSNDSSWRQMVARYLGNIAPAGSFGSIASAGHLVNLCQPAQFNTRVTEFLHHFQDY